MVIDTSVLLAIVFNEEHATWCADHLNKADTLVMSTVNLAEFLILLQDRHPSDYKKIKTEISLFPIEYCPPTVEHAELAAKARLEFPLNLGDCFAYSLARTSDGALITLDRDFLKCDVSVVLPQR